MSLRYGTRTLLAVVAAPLLAVGLCRSPQALAAPPAPAATVLTLSVAARPHHPAELTLVSRLRSSSHEGGRSVAFSVVSTEFGQTRDVPIGTVETAADGTAHVRYDPTWSGEQRFVARLTGPGAHVPAATVSYRVTTSTPGPLSAGANPARPLASVGHVFLGVILTLVVLVWLGLMITLVLAIGWMPRLAGGRVD